MVLLHIVLILFLELMGRQRQALLLLTAEHRNNEQLPGFCHVMSSSVSSAKSGHMMEPRVGESHDPQLGGLPLGTGRTHAEELGLLMQSTTSSFCYVHILQMEIDFIFASML